MKQRQSKHQPLSKSLYYAMRRDLRETDTYRNGAAVLAIAKKYGVAESTVRTVRLYKTWPAFTEHKERVRARRRSIEAGGVSGVEAAKNMQLALRDLDKDSVPLRRAPVVPKQSAPAPLTMVVIGGIAVVTLLGFLVGLVVVAIIWKLH